MNKTKAARKFIEQLQSKRGQVGAGASVVIGVIGVVVVLSMLVMVVSLVNENAADKLVELNNGSESNGSQALDEAVDAIADIIGWFGLFILFAALLFIVILVGLIFRALFSGGGIFGLGGGGVA